MAGSKTFLWFDNWHPVGSLFEKYGPRVIHDAASHKEAKVSSIIRKGDWFWSGGRSDSIVSIQSRLPEVEIWGGCTDTPIWNSKKGFYSCAESWESLRAKHPIVHWWKVVWFNLAIPRHAFILWLSFKDALLTRDRLCGWRVTNNMLCLFCHARQESRDHLFFECSFSRRIWRTLMESCLIFYPKMEWEEVSVWCSTELKGKSLANILCKLSFAATVYHLWQHRNYLLHGNSPRSEELTVAQIQWEVRTKVMARGHAQLLLLWKG